MEGWILGAKRLEFSIFFLYLRKRNTGDVIYKRLELLAVMMAMLLSVGCSERQPAGHSSILPPKTVLREGDVVFRIGGGLASKAVLSIDPDGAYSHVGIVVRVGRRLMIVHAVPDEHEFDGDVDRVKLDAPDRFFDSHRALAGEVCRPDDAGVAQRAALTALATYRRGTLFDHDYNAADTTRMYCTELVAYAFDRAGRPIVGPPTHRFAVPGSKVVCWLPSDIHDSHFLRSIIKF